LVRRAATWSHAGCEPSGVPARVFTLCVFAWARSVGCAVRVARTVRVMCSAAGSSRAAPCPCVLLCVGCRDDGTGVMATCCPRRDHVHVSVSVCLCAAREGGGRSSSRRDGECGHVRCACRAATRPCGHALKAGSSRLTLPELHTHAELSCRSVASCLVCVCVSVCFCYCGFAPASRASAACSLSKMSASEPTCDNTRLY
jgi:hypothetical protein